MLKRFSLRGLIFGIALASVFLAPFSAFAITSISGISPTVGADGKTVTIVGKITSGGYDAASLAVKYGIGSDRSSTAPVTIVGTDASGNDGFSVTLPPINTAGNYGFDITDKTIAAYAGGSGAFTISNGSAVGSAASGTGSSLSIPIPIPNPLGQTHTIPDFLVIVLNALALLLAPIVTIMLMYSGFLFIAAQGNQEKLTAAKQAFMYTLIGAAITIGAKGFALLIAGVITCLGGGSC